MDFIGAEFSNLCPTSTPKLDFSGHKSTKFSIYISSQIGSNKL